MAEKQDNLIDAMIVAGDTPIIIPGIEGRIDKTFGAFVLAQEQDPTDPTHKRMIPSRYMQSCIDKIRAKPPILRAVRVPESQVTVVGPGFSVPKPVQRKQQVVDQSGLVVPENDKPKDDFVDVLKLGQS